MKQVLKDVATDDTACQWQQFMVFLLDCFEIVDDLSL